MFTHCTVYHLSHIHCILLIEILYIAYRIYCISHISYTVYCLWHILYSVYTVTYCNTVYCLLKYCISLIASTVYHLSHILYSAYRDTVYKPATTVNTRRFMLPSALNSTTKKRWASDEANLPAGAHKGGVILKIKKLHFLCCAKFL